MATKQVFNVFTGKFDTVQDISNLVTGPASSTDNAVVRYDGTTGKLVQDSGVTIDDSGNVTIPGNLVGDTYSNDVDAVLLPYNTFSQTLLNNELAANVANAAPVAANERTFSLKYYVEIDATTPLYESGTLEITQKASGVWVLTQESQGDDSLVVFDVDNTGQVNYTTPSYAGFVDGQMRFKLTRGVILAY